jgi:hypothetical protein
LLAGPACKAAPARWPSGEGCSHGAQMPGEVGGGAWVEADGGGGVEGVDGGQRTFRAWRPVSASSTRVRRPRPPGPARCTGPRSSRLVIRWCMDCGRSETMRARSAWLRSGSSARAARTPAAW